MRKAQLLLAIFMTLTLTLMVPALAQGPGGPQNPPGTPGGSQGDDQGGSGNNENEKGDNVPNGEAWGWKNYPIENNLVLPHLAVGGNVTTTVILANLGNPSRLSWLKEGDCIVSGQISFFDDGGEALPVKIGGTTEAVHPFTLAVSGVEFLEVTLDGDLTKGWALIEVFDEDGDSEVEQPDWGIMDGEKLERGGRVMASAYYTIVQDGEVVSQVAVRPAKYEREEFLNSIVPVQVSEGVNTGIALVNTGAEAATVTLRLRNTEGVVDDDVVIDLPAGAQSARFVSEIFGLSGDFKGVLEVSTESEGIVGMGLLQTGMVMTSLPVHHYGRWSRD